MKKKDVTIFVCEYDQSEWDDPRACKEHELDIAERLHREYINGCGRYLFYDMADNLILDSTEDTNFGPFAEALRDKGWLLFITHPSYKYEDIEKFFIIADLLGRPCYYNTINMNKMVPHMTLVHNNVSMYRRTRDCDVLWRLEQMNYMRYVSEEFNRAANIQLKWDIKED